MPLDCQCRHLGKKPPPPALPHALVRQPTTLALKSLVGYVAVRPSGLDPAEHDFCSTHWRLSFWSKVPERHVPTPWLRDKRMLDLARRGRRRRGCIADRRLVLWIPTTTEHAEHAHGGTRRIGPICVDLVLHGQQLAVCIQDVGERDRAALIGLHSQVTRLDQRLRLV